MAPTLGKHDYGDKLVLKAGTSAVIEIPFAASPEPSVDWKYKGGHLPDARRFRDETVSGMTSLSMSKVTKKDAGDYSMTLQNQLGTATFTIKLVVQGPLTIRYDSPLSGGSRRDFLGLESDEPPRAPPSLYKTANYIMQS